MKNAYYYEMKEIFENNESLKEEHAKLYETVSLICVAIETQIKSNEINMKLNELNSETEEKKEK